MMRIARLFLTALMVPSIAMTTTATAPPTSPPPTVHRSPAVLVHLPGETSEFSNYDYRQAGAGSVDWPVTFVFTGNATVDRVKDALCHATATTWAYCDTGSSMYLDARQASPGRSFDGFVADGGIKRFAETCATNDFTAHMRIYAPPAGNEQSSFVTANNGSMVVATTHLDFQDHAGCSGRIHGYTDVAEKWFIDAMRAIPGWEIHPDAMTVGNGNDTYVVLRELGGAEVPHVYGNDGMATEVVIH